MSDVFEHTVTRLRAPLVVDKYSGEEIRRDWSRPADVDRLTVTNASVQPEQGSEEAQGDRELIADRWRLWAEGRPDITDQDRIEWAGVPYEIDGHVGVWDDAFLPHVTCLLKRVTG